MDASPETPTGGCASATGAVTRSATPSLRGSAARWGALLIALIVLVVVVVASLAIGSLPVSPAAVWAALSGGHASAQDAAAVVGLRLPRTCIALSAGVGLAASGALVQAVTRNPLADPGALGVTSGAGFAVALAVAFAGVTAPSGYVWFALAGAAVATAAVFTLGSLGTRAPRPEQLLLAGIAFSAVLSGIISAIRLSDPQRFDALQVWAAGTVRGRGWDTLVPALPFLVFGVVLALLLGRSLNALALGDDRAVALGSSVLNTRIVAVAAITLMVGSATAVTGPIAFVGLMIPHIARWITGPDQRWISALSLVLGPVLLVAADIAARVILWPGEAPVSVVTAFLGAPTLIVLVRRRQVRGA